MDNIYLFDKFTPPKLNEKILQKKLEARYLKKQIILISLSAILMQTLVIILGIIFLNVFAPISLFCFIYTIFSMTAITIVTIFYTKKGGFIYV